MAPQFVYFMQNVGKIYPGGKEVLKNINLQFLPGVKIGILGENGAGKSTLLKIMAGVDKDITGEAWAADGITIGYLPQEPKLNHDLTVGENVMLGLGDLKDLVVEFEQISAKLGEVTDTDEMEKLLTRQAELSDKITHADAWDLQSTMQVAMDALRCPPEDWGVKDLSGGEMRRVALCQLLLQRPDILLLDEPTNHLDADSIAWLERFLEDYKGTVVMVTHDRYFLDNVTGWILELDRGTGIPYQGNYSTWLKQKQQRLEQEGKTESARMKFLKDEEQWIKSNPKARQTKSQARINAYEEMLQHSATRKQTTDSLFIPPGPRLGHIVIEAKNLTKAYNDKLLFDDLSFTIPPGAIVGIIGANGVGKTTLFRLLSGQEKPDAGDITVGETVTIGYQDQRRDSLDAGKTVWEEISNGLDNLEVGGRVFPSRGYVGLFNFKGPDQQKKVGLLSGGERNRIHLAKVLKSGGNLLLLDEPTNDLDVETLRALEEAILEFAGSAVIISHDRMFLDKLASHILAFEDDGMVQFWPGNYQSYVADRKKRLGAEADKPHRPKFRKFSR
ncbi:MAG: energy-dependent translational throttle protein EttA [Hydrotalea sp.]|nr:energy-dependent translational throttle protein EttA [Hydrotalea sp.]